MSYLLRRQRVAYDNIAVGSVTGRERTKGTNSTELLAKETFVAGTAAVRTTDGLDHIITSSGGATSIPPAETMVNTN